MGEPGTSVSQDTTGAARRDTIWYKAPMPGTPTPDLVVHDEGPVRWIRFSRPERKNALTRAMYQAAADALAEAQQEGRIRAVVFAGEGGAFTSGNDLVDFAQDPPTSEDTPVFRFLLALVRAEKPVLAAVEGPAVGIGTTMLLHCDLVAAGRSARFHLPFVRLGLCPEGASSLLLPRQAGFARASKWLLLGEPFGAVEAAEAGIVTEVTEDGGAEAAARRMAEAVAELAPSAVRETKALLRAPMRERIEEVLRAEGARFLARLRSPEAKEAFAAFFARRKPDFSKFE